ncbi:PaaI family thioesterase [Mycolicibacterium boenickei]|nr:PaaI family thioesterase [Mycolicibacterium boenickei]
MIKVSEAHSQDGYDILSVDAVEERFGIQILSYDEEDANVRMRMPITALRNPFTGRVTIGPLPLLVDDSGSTVAYARRGRGWPVTSELTLQLCHDAAETIECSAGSYLTSHAHPIYATEQGALAACTLMVEDKVIGTATVRTVFVAGGLPKYERPAETLPKSADLTLAELLAVSPSGDQAGYHVMAQHPDPMIFNASENVHGGIAATGMEMVGSAAIWEKVGDDFWSGSLQVNFLRPFVAGTSSHYAGSVAHAGSTVAVADAEAIGENGKLAATARLTAYRTA